MSSFFPCRDIPSETSSATVGPDNAASYCRANGHPHECLTSTDLPLVRILPSFILLALLMPWSVYAQEPSLPQEPTALTHKFTLGSYFSSGDYGANQNTDIAYFPVSYEVARFPWVLSVTVPYLQLEGPADIFLETGNIGRAPLNRLVDEGGMGDVFVTGTYQMEPILNGWVYLDFSLQAKLPTADETRDLGTGETDYGVQLDFYTTLGRNTWFASSGYRKRGRTPLYDLEDSLFGTAGLMRLYGEKTYLGLTYDYREKASSNSFDSHEVMPFVSHNVNERWNLMAYTIVGFTNSSADHTIGLQFSYTLQ